MAEQKETTSSTSAKLNGWVKKHPALAAGIAAGAAYLAYRWWTAQQKQGLPMGAQCVTTDPNTGYGVIGVSDGNGNCIPVQQSLSLGGNGSGGGGVVSNPMPQTQQPPPTTRSVGGVTAEGVFKPGQTAATIAKQIGVPAGSVFTGPGGHWWTYAAKGNPSEGVSAEGVLSRGETLAQWAAQAGVAPGAVKEGPGGHVWTFAARS